MAPSLELNSTDAYLDWDYRIVSSVIWVPLSIVGISGNLMVILVVMTVRGMKTPTNCYLVSLACADCLFFLSTIPSELASVHLPDNVFVFGRVGCSLLRFLPYLSINASSLSITAFTVERYIGICHPMKARYICTVKRAQLIIVTIWTFSIFYNSTWLFLTDLKPLNYSDWPDAYQCTFSLSRESYKAIFVIDMFMFYWIPLLLYLILYGIMARTLVKAGVFELQQPPSDAVQTDDVSSGFNCVNDGEPSAIGRRVKSRKIKSSGLGYRLRRMTEHRPLVSETSDTNGFLRASTSFSGGFRATVLDSSLIEDKDRRSSLVVTPTTIRNGNAPNSSRLLQVLRRTDSTTSYLSSRSACEMIDGSLGAANANSISGSRRHSKTSSVRESKAYNGDSLNRSRAQVVKMLIVIVVTFALFCLPYRGLVVYNSFTREAWVDQWYLLFAKTMVMVNSAINPILYNVLSGKFRNAFVVMFKRCFRINKASRYQLRQDTARNAFLRSSVDVAMNQQRIHSAMSKRSTGSRYSFKISAAGSTVDSVDRKESLCSPDIGGRGEKSALLIPTIAVTPVTADNEIDDVSATVVLT